MASIDIPNRSVFRAAEVCEIADVPAYVLRGWEAEFPDLGVAKTAGGPRVYRKVDVERVLRLKHLILVDGLTLAGARKRLMEEGSVPTPVEDVSDADVTAMMDEAARTGLKNVKRGLQWIMSVLERETGSRDFELSAPAAPVVRAGKPAAKAPAKKTPAKAVAKGKKAKGKK